MDLEFIRKLRQNLTKHRENIEDVMSKVSRSFLSNTLLTSVQVVNKIKQIQYYVEDDSQEIVFDVDEDEDEDDMDESDADEDDLIVEEENSEEEDEEFTKKQHSFGK